MTPREQQILDALQPHFPGSSIAITDFAGDQDHFRLEIISDKFAGVPRVQRQRLVVQALGPLAKEVHAFEYKLSAPG